MPALQMPPFLEKEKKFLFLLERFSTQCCIAKTTAAIQLIIATSFMPVLVLITLVIRTLKLYNILKSIGRKCRAHGTVSCIIYGKIMQFQTTSSQEVPQVVAF